MKLIITIGLFILLNINTYGQKLNLKVQNIEGWNTVLLVSDSIVIDTLSRHGYQFVFIDTSLSSQRVSYIIRTPRDIFYLSEVKIDGKWITSNAGSIGSNYEYITSAPIPSRIIESRKKREYKIIGDDLVSIKVDGVETIKDCNDFKLEREAREREYQEWLKERENSKKDTIK